MLKWALWGVAAVGVAAVIYIIVQASAKPREETSLRPLARGEMAKLQFPPPGPAGPPIEFNGPDGAPLTVGDLKGKVVVLNLWATWCPPCIAEMPTLAKLQAVYATQPLEVVAVSIDKPEALGKARRFIGQHAPLKFYNDPTSRAPFKLTPPEMGMPTTVIYGRDGVERARLAGDADWSSPEARAVVERLLAER